MTAVDALNMASAPDNVAKRPPGLPAEPHLPAGKPLRSVQSQPLPLISQPVEPRPVLDEQAIHQQVAQIRREITGTGGIVNVIA